MGGLYAKKWNIRLFGISVDDYCTARRENGLSKEANSPYMISNDVIEVEATPPMSSL